jgi:hypothetical protein
MVASASSEEIGMVRARKFREEINNLERGCFGKPSPWDAGYGHFVG